MAKRTRKDNEDKDPKARTVKKVDAQAWLRTKAAKKVIKAHQVREIMVFFKKQGITDKEEMKTFENKLNRFLGK